MLSPSKRKRKDFVKKLLSNYRITVLKDDSFEEKYTGNLTPVKIIFIIVVSFFLFGAFFWLLYAYTPIKYSIPGYPHEEIINADIQNKNTADSLARLARANDLYYKNLKAVLRGEEIEEINPSNDSLSTPPEELDFNMSEEDSLAREKISRESALDLEGSSISKEKTYLEELLLYKPVEGVISDGVDFRNGHFGIDISAPKDTRVKSILYGTVIFSGFTASGGNEIHIQHSFDLVSIYKHNSAVLKNAGEKVIAGESIAVVGNSGEHSDGTHLHFEMWQKGVPLNPESFFSY